MLFVSLAVKVLPSAVMHWIGKMGIAPSPVAAGDTHLKLSFIIVLISFDVSQGRAGVSSDR